METSLLRPLNYNTVRRHLRFLERSGWIECTGGGQRRWFVRGALGQHAKETALALVSPGALQL